MKNFTKAVMRSMTLCLCVVWTSNAATQTVYRIEHNGNIQYIIPITNAASKNEIKLSRSFLERMRSVTHLHLHVGRGAIETKNLRDRFRFFSHAPQIVDFIQWCTDGRIDLNEPKNRNIKISYLANVDKCLNGVMPVKIPNKYSGVASAKYTLPVLTIDALLSSGKTIKVGDTLTDAGTWFAAAGDINEAVFEDYIALLAKEKQASPGPENFQIIEDPLDLLPQGKTAIEPWLRKYDRLQFRGEIGDKIARMLLGKRINIMISSIKENGTKDAGVIRANFIPFEYLYLDFGLLKELSKSGYKVEEIRNP